MGWNSVSFAGDDPLTAGLESGIDQFYFVHSYYIEPEDERLTLFETDYGGRFVSGIRSGNCYATQFHPEKSSEAGLKVIKNFVKICKENKQ